MNINLVGKNIPIYLYFIIGSVKVSIQKTYSLI